MWLIEAKPGSSPTGSHTLTLCTVSQVSFPTLVGHGEEGHLERSQLGLELNSHRSWLETDLNVLVSLHEGRKETVNLLLT